MSILDNIKDPLLTPSVKDDIRLRMRGSLIYQFNLERLINLAGSQFEWKGWPITSAPGGFPRGTIDRRYLENILLRQGAIAVYQPLNMPGTWIAGRWQVQTNLPGGPFDIYGYPKSIVGIDFNGRQIQTMPGRNEGFFLIFDNQSWLPGSSGQGNTIIPMIEWYAQQLYEVEETIRINLRHQNTPYLITMPKKAGSSSRALFDRMQSFDPVIEISSNGPMGEQVPVSVLQTGVPFIGNELTQLRDAIWNRALSVLGITGVTTKQERMIVGELSLNRMEPLINLNSRMQNRMEFCNDFNEYTGLQVTCNLAPTAAQEFALLEMDMAALSGQPGEDTSNNGEDGEE